MSRKKRNRMRLIWVLLLLFLVGLTLVIRIRLFPLIEEMAYTSVLNQAMNSINDAVSVQIETEAVDYSRIVTLEKDGSGGVTALKTNVGEINRLKAQVLDQVNEKIMELTIDEIGVPVGNLIFPEFFAGRGFFLPVKIVAIRNSDASFRNAFSQAGINQTLHQIWMDVAINVLVLTPAGTQNITASSQVVVAETVIVGTVPDSYVTFDANGQKRTKDAGDNNAAQ